MNTRKQKKSTWQLVVMLLLILLIAGCLCLPASFFGGAAAESAAEPAAEQPSEEETTLATEGTEAPDFTVTMFDGSEVTLSSLRGRVVLVNFWATWCPPCREELTRVERELIDRFAGRPFTFLPISRGEEREAVAAFREKMGYAFPMGLDPERTIYDRYASNYIPRNFLIGPDGRIVLASVGYEPEEFDALTARIEALLQEHFGSAAENGRK